MSTQPSLLDLFDQQLVNPSPADPAARPVIPELNPFRKQQGNCECGETDVRIYWCHYCGQKRCWSCHLEHTDPIR